jgi:hypothetical protein
MILDFRLENERTMSSYWMKNLKSIIAFGPPTQVASGPNAINGEATRENDNEEMMMRFLSLEKGSCYGCWRCHYRC